MKDVNDLMPKVPNMKWGMVTNYMPTNLELIQFHKIFPHNGKWHTVFLDKDEATIDNVSIRRRTAKSMA